MEKQGFEEIADKTMGIIRDELDKIVIGHNIMLDSLKIAFIDAKITTYSDEDAGECPNLLMSVPFEFVHKSYWDRVWSLHRLRLSIILERNGIEYRVLRVQMYMTSGVRILEYAYRISYKFDGNWYRIIEMGIASAIEFIMAMVEKEAEHKRWMEDN